MRVVLVELRDAIGATADHHPVLSRDFDRTLYVTDGDCACGYHLGEVQGTPTLETVRPIRQRFLEHVKELP